MMLKTKLLIALCVPLFTGCATVLHAVGDFYDNRDPCQISNKPATHVRPAWCGTAQSRMIIQNSHGQTIGYVRR